MEHTNMEFCLVCHGFRMMMKNKFPERLWGRLNYTVGLLLTLQAGNGMKLLFPKYETLTSDTSEQTTLDMSGFSFSTDCIRICGGECVKVFALSLAHCTDTSCFIYRNFYLELFVQNLRLRLTIDCWNTWNPWFSHYGGTSGLPRFHWKRFVIPVTPLLAFPFSQILNRVILVEDSTFSLDMDHRLSYVGLGIRRDPGSACWILTRRHQGNKSAPIKQSLEIDKYSTISDNRNDDDSAANGEGVWRLAMVVCQVTKSEWQWASRRGTPFMHTRLWYVVYCEIGSTSGSGFALQTL